MLPAVEMETGPSSVHAGGPVMIDDTLRGRSICQSDIEFEAGSGAIFVSE